MNQVELQSTPTELRTLYCPNPYCRTRNRTGKSQIIGEGTPGSEVRLRCRECKQFFILRVT